ncbi:MAG TPA: hypothetical protein VNT51_10155, partial [Miltoncostaeaceae bacterium]|nr:hypothetical protein [Miltoncostaeaceae bacterium]
MLAPPSPAPPSAGAPGAPVRPRRARRPLVRTALVAVAALLAALGLAAPAHAAPGLALSPSSGPAGSATTVTGSGLTPRSAVTVTAAGSVLIRMRTDGVGGFRTTVTLPAAATGAVEVAAETPPLR